MTKTKIIPRRAGDHQGESQEATVERSSAIERDRSSGGAGCHDRKPLQHGGRADADDGAGPPVAGRFLPPVGPVYNLFCDSKARSCFTVSLRMYVPTDVLESIVATFDELLMELNGGHNGIYLESSSGEHLGIVDPNWQGDEEI